MGHCLCSQIFYSYPVPSVPLCEIPASQARITRFASCSFRSRRRTVDSAILSRRDSSVLERSPCENAFMIFQSVLSGIVRSPHPVFMTFDLVVFRSLVRLADHSQDLRPLFTHGHIETADPAA
jgi:hypothetical protein